MDEMREESPERRLVGLLRHQNALYRRLRLLADRQKSMVAQSDTQPLLALLSERQKLVDGLVGLNEKLADYRAEWSDVYGRLDEPTREEVAGLLEEANSALSAVLQSDQRDSATLAARRQDTMHRVTAVDSGCRASTAYAAAGASAPHGVTDSRA